MNFLDIPASSSASSSFMLDETKLAAGRPELEPSISFPGQQSSSKLRSQTITPLASFLLKSYLDKEANIFIPTQGSSTTFPPKLKVFINVTHHHLVPAPPPPSSKGVSLDVWVPGVVGDVSVTVDKVGNPSLLIDVVLSTEVHTKLKKDPEFKLYIIQVALEKVEEKLSIDLSRNYSLPKTLASKGPLLPRTVILPSLPSNSATAAPPPPEPTPTVLTSSSPPPSSDDAPFLSISSSSTTRSLLPRPSTIFSLDKEKKTFTFTILVPLVLPVPKKEDSKAPKATLEFVEPGTVKFGVEGIYSLEEDLSSRLGKEKVDEKGWEAEWRVEGGKVVLKGKVV
ncbi:pre-RNA processing PIH1/Nop17-domain-containing protein [Mrakia frigida]|uniref:pre-RNA processing PIH1/Nop17-domain-containing protein n=1 Tax=Mrakia frigida TaxID=29902 RepID=UPI003FCC036F